MRDQLLCDSAVYEYPAGHLPHAFVGGLARLFGKRNVINGIRVAALAAATAGELRTKAYRAAFVVELTRCHGPAAVDLTDNGVVTFASSTGKQFRRVKTRLRYKVETDELRQMHQTIRSTFARFVSPSVVEQLLRDPSQVAV